MVVTQPARAQGQNMGRWDVAGGSQSGHQLALPHLRIFAFQSGENVTLPGSGALGGRVLPCCALPPRWHTGQGDVNPR
jgi:hypothetical protein